MIFGCNISGCSRFLFYSPGVLLMTIFRAYAVAKAGLRAAVLPRALPSISPQPPQVRRYPAVMTMMQHCRRLDKKKGASADAPFRFIVFRVLADPGKFDVVFSTFCKGLVLRCNLQSCVCGIGITLTGCDDGFKVVLALALCVSKNF